MRCPHPRCLVVRAYAEIEHNRILGVGPTATIAQNGVQASRGATAKIRHNFIAGHLYTPQTVVSTGIIAFDPGTVLTEHNTLSANDVGLDVFDGAAFGTAAGSVTSHNRIRASTFDAIALFPASGQQVAHNVIDQNSGPGVGVYDSQDNTLDHNSVEDNDDSGILLDNADDNTVEQNQVRNNGTAGSDVTDGIRVNALSTGNIFQGNHLRDNVTHDCHDDSGGTGTAGTANTWLGNHGETENVPGLCTRDGDDESFAAASASGWDPTYPWYASFGDAAEYDWAAAYATIDTGSLLQLLPRIGTGRIRSVMASPTP